MKDNKGWQWQVDFTWLAVLTGSIEVHWGAIKHKISLLSIVTKWLCVRGDTRWWLLANNSTDLASGRKLPRRWHCQIESSASLAQKEVLLSTVGYRLARRSGGHHQENVGLVFLITEAAVVKSIITDIELSRNVRLHRIRQLMLALLKICDQGDPHWTATAAAEANCVS